MIYFDDALNDVIFTDPNGVYGAGFDVELSVGRAEIKGDKFGNWVLFDLVLGGTLTQQCRFGFAEFTGLTLNIPGTHVYLKVTAVGHSMSYQNTQYIAVTELTSEIEEIIATKVAESADIIPAVSSYNPSLNQYVADASLSVSVKSGEVSQSSDEINHKHFDGLFAVIDYYESSTCDRESLYYEYVKQNECIADRGGNSSRVFRDYSSIQVEWDTYEGVTDCREKGFNTTNVGYNKQSSIETRNQCLEVPGSSTQYRKTRAVKTSILDSGVCEKSKLVVRVAEWFGSDGEGKCHSIEGEPQPTIKLFEIGKCHKVPGKDESFVFTGCYHKNSGLLTQYLHSKDCTGVQSNQREWGGSKEDSCFVGSVEGWGVKGGEDLSVQCGIGCG